jgi:hypothetical protein
MIFPLVFYTEDDNHKIDNYGKNIRDNDRQVIPENPIPDPKTQTNKQYNQKEQRNIPGFFLPYEFDQLGQQ